MAAPHNTPVFSVDQAKIYPMTSDTGAMPPVYGTGVAVPAIRTTGFSPDILSKELFGDNAVVARAAKTRQINAGLEFGKWDLDVLKIILGTAAVVDTGTANAEISTLTIIGADQPGYFKLEYRVLGVELGLGNISSVNVTLFKCKITSMEMPLTMEDYGIPSCEIAAVATGNTVPTFGSIAFNETAVALS